MFKVKISTKNAAFGNSATDRNRELAALLRDLANSLENSGTVIDSYFVVDDNGNKVGQATVNNR